MFMLGTYPLNAVLYLGSVRTEKIRNHLPLALNREWMLYPGVLPASVNWKNWKTHSTLPPEIGGVKGIPVTLANDLLDLTSVGGNWKNGSSPESL